MGKGMSKFLDMLGIGNEEEYEDIEVELEEHEITSPVIKTFEAPARRTNTNNTAVDFSKSTTTMKLILIEPKKYEEVQKITDDLKNKKATIINFEKTDKETAQRMVDFLSGATYAISGNVKKVSNSIIVVAPQNVDILGSIKYTMSEETSEEFDISKWLK